MNKKMLLIFSFLVIVACISMVFIDKKHNTEVKHFNAYKNALNKLSANDLNNVVKAENIILNYLPTTNNQNLRDKAFEYYRIKFFKILRNSQLFYKEINIGDCNYGSLDNMEAMKNYYKKKGIALMWAEGCYYVEEDNNFTINKFFNFLSSPWKEYLSLRSKEKNLFINDGALAIPWDELRQRIISWEDFINRYPNFQENNEIKAKLADYIQWYIDGKYAYSYGNGDVLCSELKESYEKFLKINKNSKFYPTVKNWYALLKKNKFVYSDYFDGQKEVINDVAYRNFKIKQPYKVFTYNKDIYNGMSP